jgi:hypothetical protein
VVHAWLLLGAVGQRANRGAGSLWPEAPPKTTAEFIAEANDLLQGSMLRCALLSDQYASEENLRHAAGNFIDAPTIKVRRGSRECTIAEPWWPFGAAEDRKPSPLRLRAATFDGMFRLVAVWDGRHHTADNLRKGVAVLEKTKEIGRQLREALPELCPTTTTRPSL